MFSHVLYYLGPGRRSDCAVYTDICITSALKVTVQAERMSSYMPVLNQKPTHTKSQNKTKT